MEQWECVLVGAVMPAPRWAIGGGKTHPAVRLDEPPELVWRASGTNAGGVHPDRGDPRARRLARTVREPTGWRSQDRTQPPRLSPGAAGPRAILVGTLRCVGPTTRGPTHRSVPTR